jgi:hypothetical protein
MSSKDYISSLLNKRGIIVRENQKDFFDVFVIEEQNIELVNKINEYQKTIMNKWEIQSRIEDIKRMNFPIQNGTVGKEYKSLIDFKQ